MISVVICTYNREKYLGRCLQALIDQDCDKSKYEIILVDNNSTDSTASICHDFIVKYPEHNIIYEVEERQGLSFGRNKGIKLASGDYIIYLDDDAFARKDYLSSFLKFTDENPTAKAFGGKINPLFEKGKPKWMSRFLMPLMASFDYGDVARVISSGTYPIGANMAFMNDVFEKYGNFNTSLGRKGDLLLASEEKDLFFRLEAYKIPIYYLPQCIVDHIIPEKRIQIGFIRKQGTGIGFSERLRVEKLGLLKVYSWLFNELYKWIGSLAIAVFYLLTFKPEKGIMIIRFRYWVTKGFLLRKSK